jgi:hypothetical protein
LPSVSVDRDKRPAGFERFLKVVPESLLLIAVTRRMDFPDHWIRRNGEKWFPIFGAHGPQFKEFAD